MHLRRDSLLILCSRSRYNTASCCVLTRLYEACRMSKITGSLRGLSCVERQVLQVRLRGGPAWLFGIRTTLEIVTCWGLMQILEVIRTIWSNWLIWNRSILTCLIWTHIVLHCCIKSLWLSLSLPNFRQEILLLTILGYDSCHCPMFYHTLWLTLEIWPVRSVWFFAHIEIENWMMTPSCCRWDWILTLSKINLILVQNVGRLRMLHGGSICITWEQSWLISCVRRNSQELVLRRRLAKIRSMCLLFCRLVVAVNRLICVHFW